MGRAPSCDAVIDDATLSRHHLTVDVSDDLPVTVIPNPEASNGTFIGTVPVKSAQFIMALTPLMFVGRWVSDRRGGRKSYAKEREAFLGRLDVRAADVAAALEDERKERFSAAPDVAELARRARFHEPSLWENGTGSPRTCCPCDWDWGISSRR